MDANPASRWVIVASFLGLDGDFQADLLVTNLVGQGVPAQRLPCWPTTALPMHSWPMIRSVQVLVPGELEENAREIIDAQPSWPMRPQLRLVFQCAVTVAGLGVLGSFMAFPRILAEGADFGAPAAVLAAEYLTIGAGLWAFGLLVRALVHDGRLRMDARPLVVALLFYLPALLVLGPVLSASSRDMSVVEREARFLVVLALYIGLPVLLVYDRRVRHSRERDE